MATVTGTVLLPDGASFSDATVFTRVSKTGMLDAPAEVVAQQVFNSVSAEDSISFDLNVPVVENRERYSVSVHISLSGDDDIQKGDYITKRNYAVLTYDAPSDVSVQVEVV